MSWLVAALLAQLPVLPEGPPPEMPAGDLTESETGSGGEGGFPPASSITKEYLDSIVLRLAREGNAEGIALLAAEDYPAALTIFLESHALAPEDAEITHNVALAYDRLDNRPQAERFYRLTLGLDGERVATYLALADLLADQGPDHLAEVDALLLRARELGGNKSAILLRQARVATRQAKWAVAERLYLELFGRDDHQDPGLEGEIGDFYRDFGHPEEALRWYRRLARREDPNLAAAGRERIRQLEIEDQARRFGFTGRSIEISPRARALSNQAKALVRRGQLDEAERVLREALELAPVLSEARQTLGDVLRQRGGVAEAETAYLRALAFDQGNADLHVRLAELYLADDPPRPAAAVVLLERALQLAPQPAEVQRRLVRAYCLTGDLPRALRAVEAYLPEAPAAERWEAELMRESLLALLGSGDQSRRVEVLRRGSGRTDAANEKLLVTYNKVRVLLARGEPDAAMLELQRLAGKDGGPTLRNLEARILKAVGRPRQAIEVFASSLALHGEQSAVYTELGLLHEELGEPENAWARLLAAEELGDMDATFHLARLTLRRYQQSPLWRQLLALQDLFSARQRTEGYLLAKPAAALSAEARVLAQELRSTLWSWLLGFAALTVLLLLLSGFGLYRRRGGETLAWLLRQHPEAGPEVQRVLAAIRHEVLKHNTMVLTGLADVFERGEGTSEAAHVSQTLVGEDGVASRLHYYRRQLDRIGRAHGVRLNLLHKDPALSALHRGFRVLAAAAFDLRRVARLGAWRQKRLLARLKRAARLLNVDGYQAVCALLAELRVLSVDEALLRDLYARIGNEPALRTLNLAPLDLHSEIALPCAVSISRAHFEDLLGNLLRNAVQATAADGQGEIAVGLAISVEVNAITGHERVCFAVQDRSSQSLTSEVLRGHDIEGGLGLVSELVARYDGTVVVDQASKDWSKAVVVKLPQKDQGDPG